MTDPRTDSEIKTIAERGRDRETVAGGRPAPPADASTLTEVSPDLYEIEG